MLAGTRVIRALPALLVNQIAAGEVVERPASVVKELVDNAIDAGGDRITVELEQGGIELIRVTDDGCGIPAEQLPLALAPHATSKISAAEDLERIATMGFRGEALASITSVARLTIRSRPRVGGAASEHAAVIEAEGDLIRPAAPASGPVGTSITVRNLFFNTPARRKFLRTPATEQGRCGDVVREAAMAHPAIGFQLMCDGRVTLDLPAGQSPRERIVAVMGKELAGEFLEVSGEDEGYRSSKVLSHGPAASLSSPAPPPEPMTLWGLVGRPSLARHTAQAQHVFLNGRPIRDKTIMHAIKEAFRGLIEPGRHPTAVLLLEMDPAGVDVNVHPTKSEVRFRESSRVHSLVLRSIQETLRRADLTPSVMGGGAETSGWGGGPRAILPEARPGAGFAPAPGGASASGPGGSGPSASAFRDYFTQTLPGRTGGRLDFDALRGALDDPGQTAGVVAGVGVGPGPNGFVDAPAPAQAQPEPAGPMLPTPTPARPIIQVHNSYLVTQDEQGMVIIDQHALHERVMFEKLLARVGSAETRPVEGLPEAAGSGGGAGGGGGGGGARGTDLESQRLLTPVVVPASARRLEALEAVQPLLKRLGIEAEPMGPGAIGIQSFSSFLFERHVDAGEFLSEVLDRAAEEDWGRVGRAGQGEGAGGGGRGEEAVLHEVLDMMACKAAIKAGDRLSEGELAELLALRERIERSSNCPHGRPTSIRMTIKELERRFGRA